MKVILVRDTALFKVNSADANRTLGLMKGLKSLNLEVESHFLGINPQQLDEATKAEFGTAHYYSTPFKFPAKLGFLNSYLFPFLYSGLFAKRLIKKSGQEPVIFWIQDSLLGFKVGKRLKKSSRKGLVFLEMSEFPDFHREHNLSFRVRLLKEWKLKEYLKHTIDILDGIALMTRTLVQNFKNPNNLPVLHLPMTVDIERFSQKVDSEQQEQYLAYIGLLGNHKDGIDVLLQAFKAISEEFPEVKLKIAGPRHEDSPKHEVLLQSLDLKNQVQFIGELDKTQIPSFLLKAKVLLLPRPASRQAQGGFPTKLGEYLATAKPVCATTVGEIPNYLSDGETVIFAEPGNAESFASAMRRALSNPEEAEKIGANGRKVAEKEFNASIQAEKLKNYFEQLLEKNKYD